MSVCVIIAYIITMLRVTFLISSCADNGIWKEKQQLLCYKQHIL